MTLLDQLASWYRSNCNGDWEHLYGIRIDTLDNPGWAITIDLRKTPMEGLTIKPVHVERSNHDWISYKIESEQYKACGGPINLEELLTIFLKISQNEPVT